MNLKAKAKRAVQSARAELADAVKQVGEQSEIRDAREALARRRLPAEERAAAKAERRVRAQEQARVKAAEFRQRSEQAQRAAAEAQKRAEATLRKYGIFLGTTRELEGVLLNKMCEVVFDSDGVRMSQVNWSISVPWSAIENIEIEDASESRVQSRTRQRLGHMGGVYKWAQFVPVAEIETVKTDAADVLIESDRGTFYLLFLGTPSRTLRGWLMRTEGLWKDKGAT